MFFCPIFIKRLHSSSSSSSLNLRQTETFQNLFKRGFSPTLKTLNHLLLSLLKTSKFLTILSIYSQMPYNKIKPNSQTNSIISRALLQVSKFEDAKHLIGQLQRIDFSPQKPIWDTLIQQMCNEERNPEKALCLLQHCVTSCGIFPSLLTFYSLVSCLRDFGMMDKAMETVEFMIDQKPGYPLDNFLCSSIMSGFCDCGKPGLALAFYNNAIKTGRLKPNVVTYTALVNALCKECRVQEIGDLVCEMEKGGVVFDEVFYSSWIHGYLREGILVEAFQKHKLMLENGIKPDVVSYSILIDGFSREGNVEKAIGFLNEMKKDGLEPNLITYTTIMRGLIGKGKLKEAFIMLRKVEELRIEVDEVTYAILIDGLCRKGDLDCVLSLLGEVEQKGVSLGSVTYNTVINGLCKFGRIHEADEISNRIACDNFTYSTLMHAYTKDKNVAGVLDVKKRFTEAGVVMDVVMCNVLIKSLFMLGAFEDAYSLFNGMADMGLVANSFTYCTIISGCCRVGRIAEALEIFDEYKKTSFDSSNVSCYNCIIGGLCQEGMVQMATKVFTELVEKGLMLDDFVLMKLIDAKYKENGAEGVLEFLRVIEGLEAEVLGLLYNDAINFFCKKGVYMAAFDVYMVMRRKALVMTIKSYCLILRGLIRHGNTDLVQLILNAYLKDYGILDPIISNVIVNYLCKKDVKYALQFLNNEGEKMRCIGSITAVFNALIKQGRAQDAHELLLEAGENIMVLDVADYSIVIDGLCKAGIGYLEKALDLCQRMRRKRVNPDIVTYNSVINALCQHGCLVQALRLFDSLEKINVLPTVITYSTLIDTLSREGFLEDASELLKRMVLNGLSPNTRVYNSLISGYCRSGSMDEALNVLLILEKSCLEPDAFTVSFLINGFCVKGDLEGALSFFGEYKRRGFLPDFLGFMSLVRGLCTKGRMEEARTILQEMLQSPSLSEHIDKAGKEIEMESLTYFLGTLVEQGSIHEVTYVLNEVGHMIFPLARNAVDDLRKVKKVHGKNALQSMKAGTTGFSLSETEKADGERENGDHLVKQFPSHSFDGWYSSILSLCSQGELKMANKVVKDMLSSLQESC